MSTHQDTAARYARVFQALAALAVVFAGAMFLAPFPAPRIEAPPAPARPADTGGAAKAATFRTAPEDWTTILASLSTHRDPVQESATAAGPQLDAEGNPIVETAGTEQPVQPGRPNWRYLGPLADARGKSALVEVDGKQRLLREGAEIGGFRLKEVEADWIVVVGADEVEHEVPMETSSLATAPVSQPPAAARARGRTGQPNRTPAPGVAPGDRARTPVPYEPAAEPENDPPADPQGGGGAGSAPG